MKLGYGPPDRDLLRELKQVKVSARAVVATLAQTNAVPRNFPRDVLEDICEALSGLEAGTAENCRPALEYARSKIPEIRREYFYVEDDEFDYSPAIMDEPRLYRGMPLDIRLNELIGSVTTALDEYRVQAQERFDDEVRAEEVVVLRHPRETGASTGATDVIEASEHAIAAIVSKDLHLTTNGEILARRLADSKNLATAARSQIRARRIVRRWFDGIAQALRQLPELIGRAGRAIRVGTDVADVLSEWWSRTEHELVRTAINQIREFGGALEQIGTALRRHPAAPVDTSTTAELQRNSARVEAEAEVARLMTVGEEVPTDLAESVQHLQLFESEGKKKNIRRWKDISRCRNIVSLHAQNTNFSIRRHGQFLNSLYHLRTAKVSDQNQADIVSAENLSTLTSLFLHTDALDVSPLRELTNLRGLKLLADGVEDISPIGALAQLNSLSLQANRLTDIRPLGRLKNLNSMSLVGSDISDIDPLGELTQLKSLTVGGGMVSNVSALAVLKALESLKLQVVKVSDVSPLSVLSSLTSLSIQANSVKDITPLEALSGLTNLSLEVSNVRSIDSVRRFPNLASLSLLANMAKDFSAVGELRRLSSLSLVANRADDLSCLKNLRQLTFLSLQAHNITDISFLEGLPSLTSLSLQANSRRSGFEAFSFLKNLVRLDLTGFDWGWFDYVGDLSALRYLKINGSGIVDLLPLSKLKELRVVQVNSVGVQNADVLRNVEIKYSDPRPAPR